MAKKTYFGGQALMEGVMMQGNGGYAMAVRSGSGEIIYKNGNRKSIKERHKILNLPIIRGVVSFAESMVIGFSSLTWSAYQSGEEEEEKLSWKEMAFAIVSALLLSIGFFVVLPVFIASFSLDYLGYFGRSLFEGVLRIGIFLGYVLLIRRIPDVARIFEYHGAEHKTINAWEAGLPLTVENVQKQSCINCRCGTSFILMSMIMMVIVFTFFGNTNVVGRIFTKILMMPVVMGIAFEIFRLPLRFPNSKIIHALVVPGLYLQRLTTKEPSGEELEVAITSLLSVPGFPGRATNNLPPKVISEEDFILRQEGKSQPEPQPVPKTVFQPATSSNASANAQAAQDEDKTVGQMLDELCGEQ